MKLEKAIEILANYCSRVSRCYDPDLYDSVKLAREALKVVRDNRSPDLPVYIGLLPGETVETHPL